MTLDTQFAAGAREQLIDTAAGHSPLARRTHRNRIALRLAASASAVALLTAGAVVIVGGFPGQHIISNEGPTVTQSYTGPATVEIGTAPAGANAVRVIFTCTSAGAFEVSHPLDSDGADGLSWTCGLGEGAVGSPIELTPQALVDGRVTIEVITTPGTTWTAGVQFITSETTPWGVNAKGETYGVPNENGVPDLLAAAASNCEVGYIYFNHPSPANSDEPYSIPVYKSDGVTVIGEFWIGNNAPFCAEQ